MSWNNTVRCGYCHNSGHNRRGCPKLKEHITDNPGGYHAERLRQRKAEQQPRKCSYCTGPGHTRRTCTTFKEDRVTLVGDLREKRAEMLEKMVKRGIGKGALIDAAMSYYDKDLKPALVLGLSWRATCGGDGVTLRLSFLDSGHERSKSFSLVDEDVTGAALNVLSPLSEEQVRNAAPISWISGTLFDEDDYFPKGRARQYWHFDK
jgi:hypothetical protein